MQVIHFKTKFKKDDKMPYFHVTVSLTNGASYGCETSHNSHKDISDLISDHLFYKELSRITGVEFNLNAYIESISAQDVSKDETLTTFYKFNVISETTINKGYNKEGEKIIAYQKVAFLPIAKEEFSQHLLLKIERLFELLKIEAMTSLAMDQAQMNLFEGNSQAFVRIDDDEDDDVVVHKIFKDAEDLGELNVPLRAAGDNA